MSWLWGNAPADPTAPTFHPETRYSDSEVAGELEPKDLEWMCAGGFVSETQTYYNFAQDGTLIYCQVVHSSIGVWYPTIQFTFKLFNPNTKERVWESINVSNFVTPPPGLDKRSCKSDQFSITYKSKPGSDTPEVFTIFAHPSDDLQVSIDIARIAPGWKIGNGPKSGTSYYGHDIEKPEGFMYHSFWPRTQCSGTVIYKGRAIDANGPGLYTHAIMGMRPNLIASRYNFANFQSDEHGGVSAIQSEFTTLAAYGPKGAGSGGVKVNVGSLVIGGKLVCVTAEAKFPDKEYPEDAKFVSRAFHYNTIVDPATSYAQPTELEFAWGGPLLSTDASGKVSANLKVDVGTPDKPIGLVEKVDVLAEIPTMVKTVISYVAGTKPYIYQWMNASKLKVTVPDAILPGGSSGVEIPGTFYNEASFIS